MEILEKQLPPESLFLLDHFGIIKEIFATKKPETIATQIVKLAKDFKFDGKSKDSYVSLIMENLFKRIPTAEDWREPSEEAEAAAVGGSPATAPESSSGL